MSAPIVERLLAWPASEGDALSAGFVGGMMTEAADTITDLLAALEPFANHRVHKNEVGDHKVLVGATVAQVRQAQLEIAKAKGGAA